MDKYEFKKNMWSSIMLFHSGYKQYYIGVTLVLFILLSPINVLLNPSFWVMSTEEYQMFSILLSILLGIGLAFMLVIYFTIWRVFFPTYWIVGDVDGYKMGRLYWSSKGVFARYGREIRKTYELGGYEETEITILVNQGRLLNILNPWASLTVLHLPLETKLWREPTKINVWEPSARRKVIGPNGETEYICNFVSLEGANVDSMGVEEDVRKSIHRMVETAQSASHADISLTKDLLSDGVVMVPEDIKRKVNAWEEEDYGG